MGTKKTGTPFCPGRCSVERRCATCSRPAPQLVEALTARGAGDIVVVVCGVIPRQDYQYLLDHGGAAVFGPGTNVLDAARAVLDIMQGRLRNR